MIDVMKRRVTRRYMTPRRAAVLAILCLVLGTFVLSTISLWAQALAVSLVALMLLVRTR